MNTNCLNNQRGFPIIELYIVMAIMCIIVLVAVPNLYRLYYKFSVRPPKCLVQMETLQEKLNAVKPSGSTASSEWTPMDLKMLLPEEEGKALVCPETEKRYEVYHQAGKWKLCCPDAKNHLMIGGSRSCLIGSAWQHDADSRMADDKPVSGVVDNRWFSIVNCRVVPANDKEFSIVMKMQYKLYFIIFGIVAGLIFVSMKASEKLDDMAETQKKGRKDGEPEPGRLCEAMAVVFGGIMFISTLFMIAYVLLGIWLFPQKVNAAFKQEGDKTTITMKIPSDKDPVTIDNSSVRALWIKDGLTMAWKNPDNTYQCMYIKMKNDNAALSLARLIQNRIGL